MNAREAWSATLGQLQVQLNPATYDTWLRYARYVAYEDGRLVISVPHAYARDWLDQHLVPAMSETFGRMLGRASEIQVIVWDPADDSPDVRDLFGVSDPDDSMAASADGLFDPTKTFDNLTVTDANRDTVLFCRFVLDSRFGEHPSLFIAGEPGTGKTHLLQAMANELVRRNLRVVCVNAEQFTSEMVAAIRGGALQPFRDKYRGCDVLIFDEVEFLEAKDSSQQELRYIWETLFRRKRLMIFASRRLPRDLNIQRDLRSCFNRWLLCEMHAPEGDSCAAILDAKAHELGFALSDAVRAAILERLGGDPSMIAGALAQAASYIYLTGHPLSVSMVRVLFKGREAIAPTLDATQVIGATAEYYGVTVEDMVSKRRTKAIIAARHLAMYLTRALTDASLNQIGLALGGRDHTTVMHACTKVAEALKADLILAADAATIKQKLLQPAAPVSKARDMPEFDRLDEAMPVLPRALPIGAKLPQP